MTFVLDASAIIAAILGEPGADEVSAAVVAGAAATDVNLCETVSFFAHRGATEASIRRMLDAMPFDRIPFDEELAYAAGLLRPATRAAGLSLGDRACLALAARLGGTALTADRAWAGIAKSVGVEIEFIR